MCGGTFADQVKYCSKDGKYTFHGVAPAPGARTDLEGAVREIAAGLLTVDAVVLADPGLHARAARTLERAEDIYNRKRQRTEQTTIIWIYGPTGTGKSHTVNARAPDAYCKPLGEADLKWWDDYRGEEDVWFDDFRGQIPYAELLTLGDKWKKTVSRRCRAPQPFLAKRIWITSALPPEGVYKRQVDKEDSIAQLQRRISEIIHLTERYIGTSDNVVIDLSQEDEQ